MLHYCKIWQTTICWKSRSAYIHSRFVHKAAYKALSNSNPHLMDVCGTVPWLVDANLGKDKLENVFILSDVTHPLQRKYWYTSLLQLASIVSGGFRGCKGGPPLAASNVYYFCVHNLQWQILRGFHGFHGLPSKILCANVPPTLHSHWSYALQLQ